MGGTELLAETLDASISADQSGRSTHVRWKITNRGTSWELFGARNPTFAAGGDREVRREAAERRRAFRGAYREARVQWRNGQRDVLLPCETW